MRRYQYNLIVMLAAVISALSPLYGDFNPPPGEESFFRLLSPWTLGTGPSVVSTEAPAAAAWNPASAAAVQRMTFDIGYVAIYDTEYDEGIAGHALKLGNSIPSKRGVFSWSGHLISSDYEGIDLGTMGALNLGFAKDVYEDLYVGTGLNLYAGSNDSFDWGATLDVGFIHFPASYRGLNNFRWGLTAKDIGLWYNPSDDYSAVPSPFTFIAGAAFTPVEKEGFALDLNSDFVLPSVQNVRWNIGLLAHVDDFLQVGVSSDLDARSIFDGDFESYRFIPSFGLRFSFQTNLSGGDIIDLSGRGWDRGDIQPHIGISPLINGAWGAGVGLSLPLGILDEKAPEIEIDLGDLPYRESANEEAEKNEEDSVSLIRLRSSADPENPWNRTTAAKSSHIKRAASKNQKIYQLVQQTNTKEDKSTEKNVLHKIPEAIYLSPNNDGVQDDLSFPFTLRDSRYIMGYALEIRDKDGNLVRSIGNKEERPQEITLKDIFRRFFTKKSGIPIPDTLRWDGTSEDGSVAPDGVYYFSLHAWDDNNNRSETEPYPLVIDTRDPEVDIEGIPPLDLIFSPNDDGLKDTVRINQSGTLEEVWEIKITGSNGRTVFATEYRDQEPEDFVWDGMNNSGNVVADGVYTYTISSTDRAGNSVSRSVENIIVDTEPRPVSISIDSAWFSPNSDGVQDEILFTLDIPSPESLVSWRLEVLNSSNEVEWSRSGSTNPPSSYSFNGRDNRGELLDEGSYRARISSVYRNGNSPSTTSPSFTLDITPPSATVSVSPQIFSPDGDGNRDILNITQDASVEHEWLGQIIDSNDRVIREYRWIDQPEAEIVWNGTLENGSIAEDGDYWYRLSSTDRAGNSFSVSSRSIRLSTKETVVAVFTDTEAFSPNGDGIKDEILIKPNVKVAEGVESYTITILNNAGERVKTYTGSGSLAAQYRWDGIGDSGARIPDGRFRASIRVIDRNGSVAESLSSEFVMDRVAPQAELSAAYTLFSPNGDGRRDQIVINQKGSSEELWEGNIINSDGDVVRSYRWKQMPGSLTWHGRDEMGNQLPDGTYSYRLSSTDPAGNSVRVELDGIKIDTRKTSAYLTSDASRVSPNNDGKFDTITFFPIVNLREGITDWKLEIVDENTGEVYARFQGASEIPESILWNGTDDSGRVRDGFYIPRLTVNYLKGDRPQASLKALRVDATKPVVHIEADPLPFSPDNDGVDDEVHFRIDVQDLSPIESWTFEIFDREMNLFTKFSGTGTPARELIWDGRSNNGELVISAEDYPFRFTIHDDLANTSVVSGKIPVDVLVIRDGNRLKIQIASIVFEPNSAKYSERDQETADKNMFVLDRIAEILNKYRNYRITIEGHANPIYYNDPVRGPAEEEKELKPLSEERAKTVRESLIERGIHPARMNVAGLGGTRTIADPGDRSVNWKNRRVEFILEK
jgi:flagellar hook assembly protein FlgD/outer membrane protein OmpA-like peptidoglycan-associated protein